MPNNFVSPDINQASPTEWQLLREIETAISSGGVSQDVNIVGQSADLATETTLALVPEYIGVPTDQTVADNYTKDGALSKLFRGYWRDFGIAFQSLFENSLGLDSDAASSAPRNTATVIGVLKGFWLWLQNSLSFGTGTQAAALRVTLSNDGQFVNSTGNQSDTQATTQISANTETASNGSIISLLKLIAAKTQGQTTTRQVNATLNNADVIMNLNGQTYKDFGLQMVATNSSVSNNIVVQIFGCATALTSGGNFDLIHTVTIPASASQRTYEILLNKPVRTLKFNCTGGTGGTNTISITAACY